MEVNDNRNISKKQEFRKQTQVNFDVKRFNQLLADQGLRMRHYKSAFCPNARDLESESHDINCTLCDNGMIEYDSEEFIGILTTSKLENRFLAEGSWRAGSAMLTVPSTTRLSYFDAIELLDADSIYSQLIKRGNANVDRTRYRIKEIKYLADAEKQYYVDTDFKINRDGRIEWTSDNRPAIDKIYTVSYEYATRYRVVDFVHLTREMLLGAKRKDRIPVRLPQTAVVQLDFLIDSDKDSNVND